MSGNKPNWKDQSKTHKPMKLQSNTAQQFITLTMRTTDSRGMVTSNYHQWYRQWETVRIGTYGARYRTDMQRQQSPKFNRQAELAKHPIQRLLPTSESEFILNDEQYEEMKALADPEDRQRYKQRLYIEWRNENNITNSMIQEMNSINEAERKRIIKMEQTHSDTVARLFGDIMGSMDRQSRELIERYKIDVYTNEDDEEIEYTYADAIANDNWFYLFQVAKQTHIVRHIHDNMRTIDLRQEAEIDKLKQLKHKYGTLIDWIQRFEDQLDICESVGLELSEEKKCRIFIHNLNPALFEDTIRSYFHRATSSNYPNTLGELKQYILSEFEDTITRRPELLKRILRGDRVETTLQVNQKKSKSNNKFKCEICDAVSHVTTACKFYNNKFTIPQNKAYMERLKKKQEKQKNEQTQVVEEVQQKETINLIIEQCKYAHQGVRSNEIDFIYDTGTETGTIVNTDKSVITKLYSEKVLLEGIGGGTIETDKAGNSIFGKLRVLKGENGRNLVSQYESGKHFQVLNPDPNTFILRGWPRTENEGKEFMFNRDEEKYGDKLLHCTIPKSYFAKNFKEQCYLLYNPSEITNHQQNDKQHLITTYHHRLNHASAAMLSRLLPPLEPTISTADIEVWKKEYGDHCSACLQGKMTDHKRVASSNTANLSPGTAAGDIMFLNSTPLLVIVDVDTKCIILTTMGSKKVENLKQSLEHVINIYKTYNNKLNNLVFDREPAVLALENWLLTQQVRLKPKAAAQKVGLAEIMIRLIKDTARTTKLSVRDNYGYTPPSCFDLELCHDTVTTINQWIRDGNQTSPYQLFTGKSLDKLRDLRANWGEPVVVKRPNQLTTGLLSKGQWAIVVRRQLDGTGLLKVYLIDSKHYAHRLKFQRAIPPDWVVTTINNLNTKASTLDDAYAIEEEIVDQQEPATQVTILETNQSKPETAAGESNLEHNDYDPEELEPRYWTKDTSDDDEDYEPKYWTRDAPSDAINATQPEQTNVEQQLYLSYQQAMESKYEARPFYNYLLYEQALKTNPEEAKKALELEVLAAESKNIWHGVHEKDLTTEQKQLIIKTMKNFKEKFKPTGEFEKYKVRILARGDTQTHLAETEGPVCRVESIFLIFCIAAIKQLEVIKIDFVAAYLNTEMPDEVKHKWLLLDKHVSEVLCDNHPTKWRQFLRPDGRILVQMNKMLYGYKEAAYYWNQCLMNMFIKAGYTISKKDKCLVYLKRDGKEAYIAITVDDCCCAITRDKEWKEELINVCKDEFQQCTIEEGDSINVIGMNFQIDREDKSIKVQQKHYINTLKNEYIITRKAVTPATDDLFVEGDSPLLSDQIKFMSINSSCMYAGKRTYPEILPITTYLATKYWKATEEDYDKAIRVIEYLNLNEDHHLLLKPKSFNIICAADASYAEHHDAKSHTGGVIGFEGYEDQHTYFIFVSSKQPIIAKSACEAELIAQSTVGDYVVWLKDIVEELQLPTEKAIEMQQDNKSAMHMTTMGTGTFKRSKHIKVRYFWLKDLIDAGTMKFKYVPSLEMVADILSKPLTGYKFKYLLRKLLGQGNDKQFNMTAH